MTHSGIRRLGAACLASTLVVVVSAGPAQAEGRSPVSSPATASSTPLRTSAENAVRRLATAPAASQSAAQAASTPDLDSPSFFKTPLGLVVLAVVGTGTAYALYSAQHDRIHSPARK